MKEKERRGEKKKDELNLWEMSWNAPPSQRETGPADDYKATFFIAHLQCNMLNESMKAFEKEDFDKCFLALKRLQILLHIKP